MWKIDNIGEKAKHEEISSNIHVFITSRESKELEDLRLARCLKLYIIQRRKK